MTLRPVCDRCRAIIDPSEQTIMDFNAEIKIWSGNVRQQLNKHYCEECIVDYEHFNQGFKVVSPECKCGYYVRKGAEYDLRCELCLAAEKQKNDK